MADEKKFMARLTRNDGEDIILEGDESKVKAALMALGELFLSNDAIMSEQLDMVVDIGEELFGMSKEVPPEHLAMATRIFAAAEEYGDPRASDFLSCVQKNPLVTEAMWLRAADRNAPCPVENLKEDYKEQAAYWRKKIADAESKPFDGDAPSDEAIFRYSERMKFIDIYRRALSGDLDAMKLCLDFCEEEAAYWDKRNP